MLVHGRVAPSIKFAGTHLYTWVERGTVGVKFLAQVHSEMTPGQPGLEPGSLDPGTSALPMRPLRLNWFRRQNVENFVKTVLKYGHSRSESYCIKT